MTVTWGGSEGRTELGWKMFQAEEQHARKYGSVEALLFLCSREISHIPLHLLRDASVYLCGCEKMLHWVNYKEMKVTLASGLKVGKPINSGKGPRHSPSCDDKEAERGSENGRKDTVYERQREDVPLVI